MEEFEHTYVSKLHNLLKNLMCSLSLGVPEALQYSHIVNRKREHGN